MEEVGMASGVTGEWRGGGGALCCCWWVVLRADVARIVGPWDPVCRNSLLVLRYMITPPPSHANS